ncbi:MAG: twin-arginine translocase TatA/TatE family subunit, partial [Alphaproteobacteria bacterium]
LLFGRGKISDLMGDVAKGIKSFKKGIAEDESESAKEPLKSIEHDETEAAKPAKTSSGSKAKAS